MVGSDITTVSSQVEAFAAELIHLEGHVPLMLLYLRGMLLDIEEAYTTAE